MQIYCPQCHTGYQVDDNLFDNVSRKLKCSGCGAVFTIEDGLQTQEALENSFDDLEKAMAETFSEDVSVDEAEFSEPIGETTDDIGPEKEEMDLAFLKEEVAGKVSTTTPEEVEQDNLEESKDTVEDEQIEEPVDLEKIFERLSEHTEHLMESEKKLPFYEKFWLHVKNVLGFHFKIRWVYVLSFCALFAFVTLYNNRYDVVRKAPFMNVFFKSLGIKAKIVGEGLEFQNIGWEFAPDEEGTKLEIKGFITNLTDKSVDLPTVHIEILDKETSLLQSQNKEMRENKIDATSRLPLDFVIRNPAPTAKYVYMTFIDKD